MQATNSTNKNTVENIFNDARISYQSRGQWLYLCHIKGKEFYYSPKTGKWRVKGNRVWKLSEEPLDFLRQAFKYCSSHNNDQQTKDKRIAIEAKVRT